MDIVKLTPTKVPELFLEAENITPDVFAGKNAQQIADLHVHMGNTTIKLGDYFSVEGKGGATAADTKIIITGDVSKVKYIGMKMTAGEIEVQGSTDMYTGAWMTGGKIHVKGSIDSFCGLAMAGGEMIVDGNAKTYLGASYRGDWRGMKGGKILVKGNAGSDLGTFMIGGTIEVGGDVDVHVGTHAEGGRIIIRGNAKGRVGGQMVKGEVYVLGKVERMMPTFKPNGVEEVELDGKKQIFQVYIGDLGERHGKRKGEIVYGKIYIPTKAVAEEKTSPKSESRVKLSEKQKTEVAEALKEIDEPSVQLVKALVSEKFGIDIKPVQASRLISEIRRKQ